MYTISNLFYRETYFPFDYVPEDVLVTIFNSINFQTTSSIPLFCVCKKWTKVLTELYASRIVLLQTEYGHSMVANMIKKSSVSQSIAVDYFLIINFLFKNSGVPLFAATMMGMQDSKSTYNRWKFSGKVSDRGREMVFSLDHQLLLLSKSKSGEVSGENNNVKKIVASTCIYHNGSYLFGITEDRTSICLKDLKPQMGFSMCPKFSAFTEDCFLDLDEKWREEHGKIQKIYASGDFIFACCQKGEQFDIQQEGSLIKWDYAMKAIVGCIPLPTLDISLVDKHIVVRSSLTQIELIPFDLDMDKKIILESSSLKYREVNVLKVEEEAIYFAILKGEFKTEGLFVIIKKLKSLIGFINLRTMDGQAVLL